jgi:hypothetical protein
MTTPSHPDLLAEIAAHCARLSISKSAFGQAAVGDPRLVFDLESGRELRRRTVERIRNHIAKAASQGAAA